MATKGTAAFSLLLRYYKTDTLWCVHKITCLLCMYVLTQRVAGISDPNQKGHGAHGGRQPVAPATTAAKRKRHSLPKQIEYPVYPPLVSLYGISLL